MDSTRSATRRLEDPKVSVKVKLSGLWTSVMFCYIYADYFGLYKPGNLQAMLAGRMGPLGPTTQGVLVGTSAMLAIPSVMIFLSLVLKPGLNRWLNIVFGVLYSLIIVITAWHEWAFYKFWGVIEVALTTAAAWYAWRWPLQASDGT
jgi:hypothetical protein